MKEEKREFTIALPGLDVHAKIFVHRRGQQEPDRGDDVIVRGSLWLPLDNPTGKGMYDSIHKSLRFEARCPIMHTSLHATWGSCNDNYPGYRGLGDNFSAKTWAEAFQKAETALRNELQKLVNVLENRQQALIDAEK